jgi:hypothetical protein
MPTRSTRAQTRARVARRVLPVDRVREPQNTDSILLDGRRLDMVIGRRLIGARLERTIDGASTLTLQVWDRDRAILSSGALGLRVMSRVAKVQLDGITYSIAGVGKRGDTLTLTCEEQIVVGAKRHGKGKPLRFPRGRYTRAQACASMLRQAGYPVLVLDEAVIQPIAGRADLRRDLRRARAERAEIAERSAPSSRTAARGLPGSFTIKGDTPDAEQRRNVALALRVAAEEQAGPRATLALLVAGIGESGFKDVPNAAGSPYGGVWQALKTRRMSTEEQARSFLRGGRGFQAGGAIALARAEPGITPGAIATRVEASGQPAGFYDAFRAEADTIYALRGEDIAEAESGRAGAAWVKQYAYERRKDESTYTACRRLLEEVRWRLFVREGVFVIASDPALMRASPSLTLASDTPQVDSLDFEWHRALRESEMTCRAYVDRYQADPGEVALVRDLPEVEQRWLISSVAVDLLDAAEPADIALRRPQDPAKEPSSEVRTSSGAGDDNSPASGGSLRARIVAEAEKTLTSKTGFSYYSLTGAMTDDPMPRRGLRSDCSQWVRAIYLKAGAQDPGTNTWDQVRRGRRTTAPKPGDLLFPPGQGHVELYVGNGKTIGHGTPPIDYATPAAFPGHFWVTYDFLD